MVNAGRILIMPKGEWDTLAAYSMLDLVTYNGVAYLAKQSSTGINPKTDPNKDAYWQVFGSSVVPDNDTIIFDGNNNLAVNIDGTTIQYDSGTNFVKVAIDGVSLKYDSTNGYIYADVVSSLAGLSDVNLTNIRNGQIIAYNSASQKFVNIDLPVGGGSKIKVTTTESTLYGKTVTLSDGTHTMTGTFSNSGEYTFEGVEYTGNLIISSSDGTDTATRYLTVPYYSSYSVSLTFFEATVTVTYPEELGATCELSDGVTTIAATGSPMAFIVPNVGTWTATVTLDGADKTVSVNIGASGESKSITITYGTINLTYGDDFRGETITCTQGGTTITKTAPSGGNTMAFYPPTTGSWTISGTVGGTPYSTTANVASLSTPVSVTLETIPDGSTATPTDDIQKWLACAGIKDKAYTTLSQVLGDSETYNALLGDSNASAYMKRSTTWSTDICASQYAMNLLGQYDTACDALLSDATWASAIANSTYFESVLNVKVPVMTSNTTPSGEASATAYETGYDAWKAFNSSETNGWYCESSSKGYPVGSYIQYEFPSAVRVCMVKATLKYEAMANVSIKMEFKGSNDGSTWSNALLSDFTITQTNPNTEYTGIFTTTGNYTAYRAESTQQLSTNRSHGLKLQFYGRTSSGEKVHGANGESAYILDSGSPITITDPSTLNAGTYTVYSTVAKDPADLTADYSKTIRICPNTKEIVVRPDNSLYWYGYMSGGCEELSTANGWTIGSYNFISPTFNSTNMYCQAQSSVKGGGIGSKYSVSIGSAIHSIGLATFFDGAGGYMAYSSSKTNGSFVETGNYVQHLDNALSHKTLSVSGDDYIFAASSSNNTSRSITLYALWAE